MSGVKKIMTYKIKELLAVLDLPEREQFHKLDDLGIIDENHREMIFLFGQNSGLADLAFRLRDEVRSNGHFYAGIIYVRRKMTGKEICDCEHCLCFAAIYEFKPIHWIIAALIAKELAKDGQDGIQ